MARTTDRKRGVSTSTGAALAAVILGSPGLAAPAPVQQTGQVPAANAKSGPDWSKPGPLKYSEKYKFKGEYAVAGVGDGHIVFEDARGKLFYVDQATGDQKFVSSDMFIKLTNKSAEFVSHPIKMTNKVRILGVDDSGKLIMSNSKGEKFHLDAATGDMIFAK